MTQYAELEIGLHRQDEHHYRLEFRFTRPDSDTEERLKRGVAAVIRFDWDGLRAASLDNAAYGKLLGENLFAPPEALAAFEVASAHAPLRLRLFIGDSAPELHALRWETLRDPRDGRCLTTDERLLFSRYLSSFDWRPIRLRPKANLRALVAIANPSDIADYGMAAVNVADESASIRAGLGKMSVVEVASGGAVTLANLRAHLREGFDILHLVAHGKSDGQEPLLWLEQETGETQRIGGKDLINMLREVEHCPRLVVLASCQSAGTGAQTLTGEESALAALGPRLAEAGIPAVLAMQGNISMETSRRFLSEFFKELQRDGQLDRAMAAARSAVRERYDWWMPALFTRLKSGKIWYAPGFAGESDNLKKWPALLTSIKAQRCTPILGAGLLEPLFGSHGDIARRWAKAYHFPMERHYREDLPQVAQYLTIHQDRMFPRNSLIEYLRQAMLERYKQELPPDHLSDASLCHLLKVISALRRKANAADPHKTLAELPFPVYIATTPCSVMEEALRDAGKDPKTELCYWNEDIAYPSIYEDEPDYEPDERRPLVYHLFGLFEDENSLVLAEDDYFDYLIGLSRNNSMIPEVVRRMLVNTALLFLGFRMEDWNFRVLFRSLMSQRGSSRRNKYAHVAAQITPEEGRISDPEGARRYLEEYFQVEHISIYWGTPEDFARTLREKLQGGAQ